MYMNHSINSEKTRNVKVKVVDHEPDPILVPPEVTCPMPSRTWWTYVGDFMSCKL